MLLGKNHKRCKKKTWRSARRTTHFLAISARADMSEPLEHCSSCYLPTSWLALPLLAKKEYNYDSTLYSFGLPEGQSLNPVSYTHLTLPTICSV